MRKFNKTDEQFMLNKNGLPPFSPTTTANEHTLKPNIEKKYINSQDPKRSKILLQDGIPRTCKCFC